MRERYTLDVASASTLLEQQRRYAAFRKIWADEIDGP